MTGGTSDKTDGATQDSGMPGPAEIWAAARRLESVLPPSPIRRSEWLGRLTGKDVYLKLEGVQPTGSFKVRGAYNKVLSLRSSIGRHSGTPPSGVVTASSGNHGAALALAARTVGVPVTVVVPETTSGAKMENMRSQGAEVLRYGAVYDDAEQEARRLADERRLSYVSAFADREVIAGQGTVAVEILGQIDRLGSIVAPVGGGGLISGVALAIKAVSPETQVLGVQPWASRPMYESFRAGRMVQVEHQPTLSEGTAGGIAESTLATVLRYVDDIVAVAEENIARAIRELALRERVVAEGAGALTTAALLSGVLPPDLPGPAVLLLSGSNVDPELLLRVLGSNG